MKIAYLHGLESKIKSTDAKIIWIKDNIKDSFIPTIDYKSYGIFKSLFSVIETMKPDLIVGSSMGGYFSYLIGSKLKINTLLFNPAMINRSIELHVDDTSLKPTSHTVYLGKNDNVIKGSDIRSYFQKSGVGKFTYEQYDGSHRVPEDVFINAIKKTLGITESDQSKHTKDFLNEVTRVIQNDKMAKDPNESDYNDRR